MAIEIKGWDWLSSSVSVLPALFLNVDWKHTPEEVNPSENHNK